MTSAITFTKSSGNVFRDLQLENPGHAFAKAQLIEQIKVLMSNYKEGNEALADMVKLHVSDLEHLLYNSRGHERFSFKRLFAILEILGYDAVLSFTPIKPVE